MSCLISFGKEFPEDSTDQEMGSSFPFNENVFRILVLFHLIWTDKRFKNNPPMMTKKVFNSTYLKFGKMARSLSTSLGNVPQNLCLRIPLVNLNQDIT